MSPCAVGGPATGWAPAADYPDMTLASAAAISAAALSPQAGRSIPSALRAPFALTNLRLGVWLANPRLEGDGRFARGLPFVPKLVVDEVLGINDEEDLFVYVADGGFEDNLGLSALVERGCRLVLAVDATADPGWEFGDLGDLPGVRDKTLAWLSDEGQRPSEPGGSNAGRIPRRPVTLLRYRHRASGTGVLTETCVLYAKAALMPALFAEGPLKLTPVELDYVQRRKRFPQQTTANQFFTDSQQSAYTKVGRALAAETAEALAAHPALRALFDLGIALTARPRG